MLSAEKLPGKRGCTAGTPMLAELVRPEERIARRARNLRHAVAFDHPRHVELVVEHAQHFFGMIGAAVHLADAVGRIELRPRHA